MPQKPRKRKKTCCPNPCKYPKPPPSARDYQYQHLPQCMQKGSIGTNNSLCQRRLFIF